MSEKEPPAAEPPTVKSNPNAMVFLGPDGKVIFNNDLIRHFQNQTLPIVKQDFPDSQHAWMLFLAGCEVGLHEGQKPVPLNAEEKAAVALDTEGSA